MPIIRVIFFLHLFLLRHNIFLWYTNTGCTAGTNYTRNFFRVYKITIIIFRYKFQNIKNTGVRHTAFNNPPRIFHVGKYETSYNNSIYVLIILIQPSYVRIIICTYLQKSVTSYVDQYTLRIFMYVCYEHYTIGITSTIMYIIIFLCV